MLMEEQMSLKCKFGIHDKSVRRTALSLGKVKKEIYCKHCKKISFTNISDDMGSWKELKQREKKKEADKGGSGHTVKLEEGKKYTLKGLQIDDIPPCLYMLYTKDSQGNEKKILEMQTTEDEVKTFHKLRNPRILSGDDFRKVFVTGTALSEQSISSVSLEIEEGEHYE